ncbi:hypothetical protein MMC25_005541 [Agyrium rufum]|nr:hypothetical protein [Agyrium rufum]
MASVSSLDKDLRNLRMDKYTPQIANEIRTWIEEVLGERLNPGDLLEALKDGTALCKMVNLVNGPNSVRFKQSSMPFVQMENISQFLRACQGVPIGLPPHDVFLTVDLYEAKDPAQVIQCIGAFSRRANALNPGRFPRSIGGGGKSKGMMSPQSTGTSNGGIGAGSAPSWGRNRAPSNTSESSTSTYNTYSHGVPSTGRISPTKANSTSAFEDRGSKSPPAPVSSWSRKDDESKTAPAWNIHQYGYMGGASQGNQGITFGGRRQITTPGPKVPSLAEKERKRREKEAEDDRLRQQAEEAEHHRRVRREAEEERAKIEEERRWEEETRKRREQEKRDAEEEQRKWEAEERRWKEEEEARLKEERDFEARLEKDCQQKKNASDDRLQGQFLSQYQSDHQRSALSSAPTDVDSAREAERSKVRDLERQLAEAKEREAQYERERHERQRSESKQPELPSRAEEPLRISHQPSHAHESSEDSFQQADERNFLRQEWSKSNSAANAPSNSDGTEFTEKSSVPPAQPPRPLPTPGASFKVEASNPSLPARPLPTLTTGPKPFSSGRSPLARPQSNSSFSPSNQQTPPHPPTQSQNQSPFMRATSSNNASSNISHSSPKPSLPPASSISSSSATRAPPTSLLEREMARERQRQQEWEENQKALKEAAKDPNAAMGPAGESWDAHQYGYLGGDNQNRGSLGVNIGGRRQILGPRPRP